MRFNIIKYKTIHIVSCLAAIGVHAGILASSFAPSDPVVLNKQAITVSFVAPSSKNNNSFEIAKKEDNNLKVKQKKSLKAQKKETKKETKENKIAGRETSGRVHKDAKAIVSAESDPIFDAKYLNNPAPYYPPYAKRKKIEGKVFLNVVVKTDGTPDDVKISQSSGSSMLDNAALSAVKKWRFIPAKKSGQLVQANVIVPIEFKII
ncbi:MAG: energy transducer TonB [Rickettsiales bacterium]|nr:energy transducer TonB [Rickettsiales bacterium]